MIKELPYIDTHNLERLILKAHKNGTSKAVDYRCKNCGILVLEYGNKHHFYATTFCKPFDAAFAISCDQYVMLSALE